MKHLKHYSIFENYGDVYFYHGSNTLFDEFDISKIGAGDGLAKFGHGFYFTDTEQLAAFYAKELSISGKKPYMYKVKLIGLDYYHPWDEPLDDNTYQNIINRLARKGYESDAETLTQELEDYGQTMTLDSVYQFLEAIFDDKKKVSEFLDLCGVSGAIADDLHGRGKIYVAYSSGIKIIDSYPLKIK